MQSNKLMGGLLAANWAGKITEPLIVFMHSSCLLLKIG
jgi:hypothetical protein